MNDQGIRPAIISVLQDNKLAYDDVDSEWYGLLEVETWKIADAILSAFNVSEKKAS